MLLEHLSGANEASELVRTALVGTGGVMARSLEGGLAEPVRVCYHACSKTQADQHIALRMSP